MEKTFNDFNGKSERQSIIVFLQANCGYSGDKHSAYMWATDLFWLMVSKKTDIAQ